MDNKDLKKYNLPEDKPTDSIENENQDDIQGDISTTSNNGLMGFIIGAIGGGFGVIMTFKAWRAKRALKKEREKNKDYQELLMKHHAGIAALNTDKEREDYKNRLWEELMSKKEE